jgi:hypothetical protein
MSDASQRPLPRDRDPIRCVNHRMATSISRVVFRGSLADERGVSEQSRTLTPSYERENPRSSYDRANHFVA